ncbi:COP9 signalosome complex subunit 6-like [Mytilus galloprovincialis]|uniref:COP9 signalosome complex subunit 6 n=2 Tax=Mytilus galloprovincialis TaxID=29158 RepID=A0A8B6CPB5_MYTGA|nr:COP9 signalosome complex subunit 6 [Mytilus galloprovincialis]
MTMASQMEIDTPSTSMTSVMASTTASGSVSVSFHPLVIMNISEHWTRVRAQEGKPTQVLGAVIGKQKGRIIEVMNSFELLFDRIEDEIVINMEYYNTKEEQFKQVFSDMDFLGWYTTGEQPTQSDIRVHKQIVQINESPLFVKMNPLARKTDVMPISIYESVIDLVNNEATMLFVELSYTIATEEAERIGVDHVARLSSSETSDSSTVAEQLVAQHSSIKMLHSRVKIILEYIKAVESGEIPKNHDILREAYSLCYRLPVLNTPQFKEDFYNQCNDVCLMAYLGTLTKGCNTMNQFVTKFNMMHNRQGTGHRMRGVIF